jgi:hypothetical protein
MFQLGGAVLVEEYLSAAARRQQQQHGCYFLLQKIVTCAVRSNNLLARLWLVVHCCYLLIQP